MDTLLLVFAAASAISAIPHLLPRQDQSSILPWATIGDSWASSVAYSDDVAFDGNRDNCLRSKESYTYQLEQDASWRQDGQNLRFAACSGARLGDMAREGGQFQVRKTGDPRILIMTAGGNDALFADVAVDCIYRPDPREDYGEPFPGEGRCKASLERSSAFMDNNLGLELEKVYDEIFRNYQDQASDLTVYHTSYVHFFNVNDNWCNDYNFGVVPDVPFRPPRNQKLNVELRTSMNDLVEKMNRIIEQSVNAYQGKLQSQPKLLRRQKDLSDTGPVIPDRPTSPPPSSPPTQPFISPIQPTIAKRSLGYINVSPRFDGHRFCEDESSGRKQYYGDDVWFWNLRAAFAQEPEGEDVPPLSAEEQLEVQELGIMSGLGGGNDIKNGWRLRPFHPKAPGNAAFKDVIIARLRDDQISGVRSVGSVVGGAIAGILGSGGRPS
ncbi:SGNH hydrolase-type esterase domain-containing protein [Elsinoe ampelina]|uniref:SGNH hydrolase-type esterase domain-containing protein n=1 Tax=Elsinoe ampelina TaxID=302913 RepID=A0A6A6GHN3_9PEZI|nr:SGNH hydrolase-type esterase domain-containing protein [Elsinoe ampelina]